MRISIDVSDDFHRRLKRMTARAGYESMSALARELFEKWLAEEESLEIPKFGTLVAVGTGNDLLEQVKREAQRRKVAISEVVYESLAAWLEKQTTPVQVQ